MYVHVQGATVNSMVQSLLIAHVYRMATREGDGMIAPLYKCTLYLFHAERHKWHLACCVQLQNMTSQLSPAL
jgi:hypothetical protein